MSQTNDALDPFDPTGLFKSLRDSSMDSWAKMMIQLVNTEAYARATATMLDAWLSTSAPFRKALESSMTQVLSNFNMPTRDDVISLAGRMTNIEVRLDDIEVGLDDLYAKLAEGQLIRSAAQKGAGGADARPNTGENQP